MSIKYRITLVLAIFSFSLAAQDINLFDEFQKTDINFAHFDFKDISTHRYSVTYGNNCELKNRDKDIFVPELSNDISASLMQKSSLYKGKGHMLSYLAFNDSIILVVVAIHGHYSTPSALLFSINKQGRIIDEIKVASVFFDAGQGELTRSKFEKPNTLQIINKDLDERPEGQLCKAEFQTYSISDSGKFELTATEVKEIECKE